MLGNQICMYIWMSLFPDPSRNYATIKEVMRIYNFLKPHKFPNLTILQKKHNY